MTLLWESEGEICWRRGLRRGGKGQAASPRCRGVGGTSPM